MKPFHESMLARIVGYVIVAYLIFIIVIKLGGYDNGSVPWSNVYYTTFCALVYLFFVFLPWKKK